jgi:hypothetical protein
VIAQGKFIYLFRRASTGRLYLNRFMLIDKVDDGATKSIAKTLAPIWEVRYKNSKLRDVPQNSRDLQDFRDTAGEPFFEPTFEIPFVNPVTGGGFEVIVVPTDIPNRKRWQLFWLESNPRTLHNQSYLVDDEGLFTFEPLSETNQPDNQQLEFSSIITFKNITAVVYQQNEESTQSLDQQFVDAQDDVKVPSQSRVMLASADTGPSKFMFVLDIELAPDGTLTRFPELLTFPTNILTTSAGQSLKPLWQDDRGLTINGWSVSLKESKQPDYPSLLNSADGNIHLYYREGDGTDFSNGLKVMHYDNLRQRPTYRLSWQSASPFSTVETNSGLAPHSGDVSFIASSFYQVKENDPLDGVTITLTIGKGPQTEPLNYFVDFMYDLTINKGKQTESWTGVPNELLLFVGTLNGLAKKEVQSSVLLSGQQAFFDYFQQQSLYVFRSDAGSGGGLVSCMANRLTPDDEAKFKPELLLKFRDTKQMTLTLEQTIVRKDSNANFILKEDWQDLPKDTKAFIDTINGKSPDYRYNQKVTLTKGDHPALIYTQATQQRGLWFIASNGADGQFELDSIQIVIKDYRQKLQGMPDDEQMPDDTVTADYCCLTITITKTDGTSLIVPWTKVPRQSQTFNEYFQLSDNNTGDNQSDVMAVVTPYAIGSEKVVNVVLNRAADPRGGPM